MKQALQGSVRSMLQAACGARLRLRRPFDHLFILGHMRSGSTLLVHLLANHPQVLGYGETHITYRRREDLLRLAINVQIARRAWTIPQRYVLEKILHDRHTPELGLLASATGARFLVLIRAARPTLSSMVQLWGDGEQPGTRGPLGTAEGGANLRTVADYTSYYIDRLDTLAAQAEQLGPRAALLLRYEDLLQHTRPTLDAVQDFLGLTSPIDEAYRTLRTTGQRGVGDSSERIRSGTIRRDATQGPVVELPPELLTEAEAAHAACLTRLRRCCSPTTPAA